MGYFKKCWFGMVVLEVFFGLNRIRFFVDFFLVMSVIEGFFRWFKDILFKYGYFY